MKKTIAYTPTINFDTFEMWPLPVLPVKISPRQGYLPFNTDMLIDSGSEDTLLEASVGTALGIDVLSGQPRKVGGITGGTIGYEHPIRIEFRKYDLQPLEVNAIFVPKMGISGILGQRDFFIKYNVCFKRNKLKFILEEIPAIKF